MMKFSFLFGAGAEIGYGLPSGGQFALNIFKYDITKSKKDFKEMIESIDITTRYASQWLPSNFQEKNISSFGKSVFQHIIKDTVEHNRQQVINRINNFDDIAKKKASELKKSGIDITNIIEEMLDKDLDNINLTQSTSFISEFEEGNKLFNNSYFSALLLIYKDKELISGEERVELGKILLSIIQLHIGALGETLTRKINDGIFAKKDDTIDIFDDLGEIIQLNYASSGLGGMEYLLEQQKSSNDTNSKKILSFAQSIMETIYSDVLDYKSLIDSNWHYLYSPNSDWAKFCKICIFLLNVRNYISETANNIKIKDDGYYHMLKKAIDIKLFELKSVATTNYNEFIEDILKTDVAFLNGSTELWYDPYVNRIGHKTDITTKEKHIIVPLMFTQSGTKPMTSIDMSIQYVDTYQKWKDSDALVIVGFGFGKDDEHINGIIRTLIDIDNKKIIIVTLDKSEDDDSLTKEYARKLKILKSDNIHIIRVNEKGQIKGSDKLWTDMLTEVLS